MTEIPICKKEDLKDEKQKDSRDHHLSAYPVLLLYPSPGYPCTDQEETGPESAEMALLGEKRESERVISLWIVFYVSLFTF